MVNIIIFFQAIYSIAMEIIRLKIYADTRCVRGKILVWNHMEFPAILVYL